MKLVILHYHLNRGGVTQVIVNHLRALATLATRLPFEQITVLYGGRREGWPDDLRDELAHLPLNLVEIPSLDYDQGTPHDPLDALRDVLSQLAPKPDEVLLHIHNHCLGKNAGLTRAVVRLAEDGYRMLLQVHDFAEDSRPANYRHLVDCLRPESEEDLVKTLYPQADHVHYATLNGRDHKLLEHAGVDTQRLHYLPNPVTRLRPMAERTSARRKLQDLFGIRTDRRFVLYPVRPIRRKNVGEMLLWSTLSDSTSYGVTLIPLNEVERGPYNAWQALIDELQLPIATGLGETGGLSFAENLAAADAVISTSIAEGFGMVFLESWLAGCPLIGRDLPDITADFRESGIQFPCLAPTVQIPRGWLGDLHDLRHIFASELNHLLQAYGRPLLSEEAIRRAFEDWFQDDVIDFARLDVPHQMQIIRQVSADPQKRSDLLELNPAMVAGLLADRTSNPQITQQNAACVERFHSLEVSGQGLLNLYYGVADCRPSPVESLSSGSSILQTLLAPDRLYLIRVTA